MPATRRDNHVLNRDRAAGIGLGGDLQLHTVSIGLERIELQHPLSVGARGSRLLLTFEFDVDGFVGIGGTPDGHGPLALQDHVIKKN